jgi:hypothetical protein
MPPNYRPNDRLIDADPISPLGARIPAPLHERIERLCEVAFQAGETRQPSKQEMAAAILLGSTTDGQELRELLRRYGEATVADALPWLADGEAEVIELPKRKPGPRSGRRSR